MRRRTLLLATCVAVPVALGAVAQQEADRRLDAAIARARAALGPNQSLDFRERRVDPVTGEARLLGVTLRSSDGLMSIEEVTLRDLDDTRVGAATVRNFRLEADGPPGATKSAGSALTVARMSLNGLVLPAAGGRPAVDWAAAAVASATIETVALTMPGVGRLETARLSLTGYAPGRVGEAVVEGATYAEEAATGQGRFRLGRARLAGAAVPRIGQPFDPWAFAADSAALEGVDLNIPRENVQMALGRIQVDGWGVGRLTDAQLGGFHMAGTSPQTGPFDLRLGRVALSGIAGRDTAFAVANQLNPPQAAPGQHQSLEAEGFAFSMQGTQVVTIGALRARNDWDAATPATQIGTVTVDGIMADLSGAGSGTMVERLGYRQVGGRIDNTTRLLRPSGQIVADPFTIRADGVGTLGFTMDVRGYQMPEPGQPSVKPEDILAMAMGWQIASFTIRYTDDGLVPRLVTEQARQTRMPEARLREQFAQAALNAPLPGDAPGKGSPAVQGIREALASFARQSGTIEFAMRPAQPMPIGAFMGFAAMQPGQIVEQLNLTATATPRR